MKNIEVSKRYFIIYENGEVIFQTTQNNCRFHINKDGVMTIFDTSNNNIAVSFSEISITIDDVIMTKTQLIDFLTANTK